MKKLLPFIVIFAILSACNVAKQIPTNTPGPTLDATKISAMDLTLVGPSAIRTGLAVPGTPGTPPMRMLVDVLSTPTATLMPDGWMKLPVVPETVSYRVRQIYEEGQKLGNRPNVFSLIGDCDATPTWFLGDFDLGPKHYNLGQYSDLQGEIAYFKGSFSRQSLAVRRGFVAASVLTTLWADPKQCQKGETPLSCELRLNKPAFAFILLGTNDYNHREVFEPNMRKILDTLIADGVVPILGTKADNMEGDYTLNATIAQLAYEYELPLWNFWAATQPLPAHGLDTDLTHLTWGPNDFSDPARMQSAWPWRNLTALQTLKAVRGALQTP